MDLAVLIYVMVKPFMFCPTKVDSKNTKNMTDTIKEMHIIIPQSSLPE